MPPKVVKRVLDLEFMEMAELKANIWVDEPSATEPNPICRLNASKPPVTDMKIWLECYGRMAPLISTRFLDKAPELWVYQSTILRAAHNYEGANWVAYDQQHRRDMLARKDLNWSTPNSRLYNEAFTRRAKVVPRCPHCLGDDHGGATCPHNPAPLVWSWLPDLRQLHVPVQQQMLGCHTQPATTTTIGVASRDAGLCTYARIASARIRPCSSHVESQHRRRARRLGTTTELGAKRFPATSPTRQVRDAEPKPSAG